MRNPTLIAAFTFLASTTTFSQFSSTPVDGTWMTNGTVNAIAANEKKCYIGGNFTMMFPYAGHCLLINSAKGQRDTSFPKVNGLIKAAIPDGANGWYISGDFSRVGNSATRYFAHIHGDNTIDTLWKPNASGYAYTLLLNENRIYISGYFSSIGGKSSKGTACLDAVNGMATDWNPNPDGIIYQMAIGGPNLYVCGTFTTIGGQSRKMLACLDTITGLATDWNPFPDKPVYTLVIDGSKVYVGGSFTSVGRQGIANLACIDMTTGLATTWNPNADNIVRTLAMHGANLYVGGEFQKIGGQDRSNLACLDTTTGMATSWNPTANGRVNTICPGGSAIYAAGSFSIVGNQTRQSIASIDTAATGTVTGWNPEIGTACNNIKGDKVIPSINAMAVNDSNVLLCGDFHGLGNKMRGRLACIDVATDTVTDWAPNTDRTVFALGLHEGKLYVGGAFTMIDSIDRRGIACIDTGLGHPTDWNPGVNDEIRCLFPSENILYVGGNITTIGGLSRKNIASVDITSGHTTDWNPFADYPVNAISVSKFGIFAGGGFTNIGGQTRYELACIDSSGNATNWDPKLPGPVNCVVFSLFAKDKMLYVGGNTYVTSFPSPGQKCIARYDMENGTVTNWNPNLSGTFVNAIAADDNHIYAGTSTGCIGIDAQTGNTLSWNPQIGWVNAIGICKNDMYIGGSFSSVGDMPRSGFARFRRDTTTISVKPIPKTRSNTSQYAFRFSFEKNSVIHYSLSHDAFVSIDLFDMKGIKVRSYPCVLQTAGKYNITLFDESVPSGLYFLKFRVNMQEEIRSISYIR
jgi:trimeric autotransporter adhesin